jgi:hypothetical protein
LCIGSSILLIALISLLPFSLIELIIYRYALSLAVKSVLVLINLIPYNNLLVLLLVFYSYLNLYPVNLLVDISRL